MNRILRAPWHDYTKRCIYMVTLNKSPLIKDFGCLEGDCHVPLDQKGSPYVSVSYVGSAIKDVLRQFHDIEPAIRILQYAIMPDHLHILLFVEEQMSDKLSRVIARFKVAVNKKVGVTGVFDKGFNDQILKPSRSLDTLFKYLRTNPYRLAVRRAHPEFFKRVNALQIGDRLCQAYGNMQLLDNPFKEQVIVHRADTPEIRSSNRERWLHTAANGGVLVSPFISPAEKDIRVEAEAFNAKIILITNETMPDRYKPAAHDFALCEAGRLLIISVPTADTTLTRSMCLIMNSLAENITNNLILNDKR